MIFNQMFPFYLFSCYSFNQDLEWTEVMSPSKAGRKKYEEPDLQSQRESTFPKTYNFFLSASLSGLAEAERSITSIALKRLYVEWFELLTYKFMIRKLISKAL